jgi:hypothetical protein
MNQYAAKAHRTDFIGYVQSKLFDFFQENRHVQKNLQDIADEESEAVDAAYIKATCNEYDLPCLEFSVHAPDHE